MGNCVWCKATRGPAPWQLQLCIFPLRLWGELFISTLVSWLDRVWSVCCCYGSLELLYTSCVVCQHAIELQNVFHSNEVHDWCADCVWECKSVTLRGGDCEHLYVVSSRPCQYHWIVHFLWFFLHESFLAKQIISPANSFLELAVSWSDLCFSVSTYNCTMHVPLYVFRGVL